MAQKNRLAILAALLLLLLSFGCTGTGSGEQKTQMMGWNLLVGVALLVVVLLLSLSYMASVFMGDERLKAWTVRELGQAFFSVLIVVAAVALVGSLDTWLQVLSLAGDPGWQAYVGALCCAPGSPGCTQAATSLAHGRACHIELATDYLQLLYETARNDASAYLSNYGWFAFLSNLSVSTTLILQFLASVSFKPFAGLSLAAEFFSLLFDLSIKTMFLLRAQQIFLDFLWYPLFPVMISMGLALRVLYFTRKLGGMMIALSLSLYVVLPMFYVLSSAILWGFMAHPVAGSWEHFGSTYNYDPAGGMPLPAFSNTALSPQQRATGVFSQPSLNFDLCNRSTQQENDAMGAALDEVRGNAAGIEGGSWYSDILDFVSGAGRFSTNSAFGVQGPIASLALLMIFTMFIPFLALMASLAAFKAFSPLLGGDVEIQLLSKLI